MFPETAQRSLEEVEDIFAQGHTFTAWRINRDVGKKDAKEVQPANKVRVVALHDNCNAAHSGLTA